MRDEHNARTVWELAGPAEPANMCVHGVQSSLHVWADPVSSTSSTAAVTATAAASTTAAAATAAAPCVTSERPGCVRSQRSVLRERRRRLGYNSLQQPGHHRIW